MNRVSKWMTAVTLCLTMLSSSMSHAYASDEKSAQQAQLAPTAITATGAVLVDMQSGQVLYEQNKDARLYPASITKIMTAMLALEHARLTESVTTSQRAFEQEGNRVYLEVGEVQPMEQMLYGLMLNSGNDAAVAIAEHIAGSVESFAQMMNDRARSLGAANTQFVTPNGLHDDNHYTTPYDMSKIAREAMKNPTFRTIVTTKRLPWDGLKWKSELHNINRMLWDYAGSTGVKTGFTDQAQQTIVVTAARNGREVMAVLMGVQNRQLVREESTKLLDYGLHAFVNHPVAAAGDVITTYEAGNDQRVQATLATPVHNTSPIGQPPAITRTVQMNPPAAPYTRGTKVGTVSFRAAGDVFATADLLAGSDVALPAPTPLQEVAERPLLVWLLAALGLLCVCLLLLQRRRRNRVRNRAYSKHL